MSNHTCHAKGCQSRCKPEYLMCPRHWRMVPKATQCLVYRHYRNGQCDGMDVTPGWHAAADLAIATVAHKEGRITDDAMRRVRDRCRAVLGPTGPGYQPTGGRPHSPPRTR